MAIETRALFALSIAFTASLVAYPDLPADVPPQAGRHGPFIGAPFVAFLLPVTGVAIWWMLARLDQSTRPDSPGRRIGAATALFLSAFHVTMLIAFIGAHLWLTRVLGVMVGAFLVLTGNELPRLRPNLVWGIRTNETLESDTLWRRVHRLGGYIRVVMGIAICIAAAFGTAWFAELIVIAVAIETVACLAAAVLLSRRAAVAVGVVVMCCTGAAAPAHAWDLPLDAIRTLPAFIDATVPKLMADHHVAGTAVVVVHDGRVTLLRGYGKPRLDSAAPVDPSRTLFRIGSVTKAFTATAAMQLAESGRLDLHEDVRTYVPDVPLRFATTTHHLLTHTAGLLERLAGAGTPDAKHLQTLAYHLQRYTPKQVLEPGRGYSYSNYHYALAGLIVERVSGRPYEDYLREHVFTPLGMTHTTVHQPPGPHLTPHIANGYEWNGARYDLVRTGFSHPRPGGSMVASAADVGRFMLAMLGDGSVDGRRILLPTTVRTMLSVQFTPDRRIPGEGYGFSHMLWQGHRLLIRGGTAGNQASLMVLAPDDELGIFVASNALPGLGDFLFGPMMTHLAGPQAPAPPPAPMPDAPRRAPRFAGAYRDYRRTEDELSQVFTLMPRIQSRVTVDDDGAIRWRGRRWIEIEPLVLRSENTLDHIVFRENDRGEVVELHAAGATHERIHWTQQNTFHLAILACCLMSFLGYLLFGAVRVLRRRRLSAELGIAHRCAVFVAAANLLFVFGALMNIRNLGDAVPLPARFLLLLSVPIASLACTALLPGFAAGAWRGRLGTRAERVGYSVFAVCAVAFMTFLNYWRLLGLRY